MLKQMVTEELNILEELIKNADIQYHDILDMGSIVPTSFMEWKKELQQRQKYLNAVLENINTNDLLNALNKE
jgi:hypothetical protein